MEDELPGAGGQQEEIGLMLTEHKSSRGFGCSLTAERNGRGAGEGKGGGRVGGGGGGISGVGCLQRQHEL